LPACLSRMSEISQPTSPLRQLFSNSAPPVQF
jgi:hypothetical protein